MEDAGEERDAVMTHKRGRERDALILSLYNDGASAERIMDETKVSYNKIVTTIRENDQEVSFARYQEGTKPAEKFKEEWNKATCAIRRHLSKEHT